MRMLRASHQSCSSSNLLRTQDSSSSRFTNGTGIPRRKMKNCKKNLSTTILTWNPLWESVKRYWRLSTQTSLEATPRLGLQMELKRTATRRRVTSWILVMTSHTKCKTSESPGLLEWLALTSRRSPLNLPREKLGREATSLQLRSSQWPRRTECPLSLPRRDTASEACLLTHILPLQTSHLVKLDKEFSQDKAKRNNLQSSTRLFWDQSNSQ